jgi:hypothetical protein
MQIWNGIDEFGVQKLIVFILRLTIFCFNSQYKFDDNFISNSSVWHQKKLSHYKHTKVW